MKVKLKKLSEDAVLPHKGKEGDFCYDVVAVSEEEVAPNVWRYKLGFAYEIERPKNFWANWGDLKVNVADFLDNFNISIDARPRSSVWKTGMILSNCEGTLN